MPRVVMCTKHRAAFYAMEADLRPGWTNRCAICHQSINPGDFIRSVECL